MSDLGFTVAACEECGCKEERNELRAELAETRAELEARVRESIASYLEHVSQVEVGSMLSPNSQQIVAFCAAWVRNRLDAKWHAETAEVACRGEKTP